jgi:hypothetical protein
MRKIAEAPNQGAFADFTLKTNTNFGRNSNGKTMLLHCAYLTDKDVGRHGWKSKLWLRTVSEKERRFHFPETRHLEGHNHKLAVMRAACGKLPLLAGQLFCYLLMSFANSSRIYKVLLDLSHILSIKVFWSIFLSRDGSPGFKSGSGN